MKRSEQNGFTLIEVIVVAGIIAILAGILVPMIFKEIDESKITRASADVHSISTALFVLRKDVGQWPVSATCTPAITLLQGQGTLPTFAAGWDASSPNNFSNYLTIDDNGCWPTTWKGPYMAMVSADPWGKAYVLNAANWLAATGPIWIISAGPNGVIETPTNADILGGDDVGIRLR